MDIFKDKVISIYSICYNGQPDQIYTFTNFEKAVSSIEGSVRGYYGHDNKSFDGFCAEVRSRIHELRKSPCIPLKFDGLYAILYSWELDHTNPMHLILSQCHQQAIVGNNIGLAEQIEKLFMEPARS